MLCQNCGKNLANVRYKQVINGVKIEMNLCANCASKMGIGDINFNMSNDFSYFMNTFDDFDRAFMHSLSNLEALVCDNCKLTYDNYLNSGRIGCEKCTDNFESKINELLKNVQGVNTNIGKSGKKIVNEALNINKENNINENKKEKVNKNSELEILQERLKKEVEEERYEDAAKTRDEIKKMSE